MKLSILLIESLFSLSCTCKRACQLHKSLDDFFNEFTHENISYVGLIKPQFELQRDKIDKGGIVNNSKLLICCEGAISHVSHSLNKKTIILIQKDRINSTQFWIGHMKNNFNIFRDDIKNVTKKVLKSNIF